MGPRRNRSRSSGLWANPPDPNTTPPWARDRSGGQPVVDDHAGNLTSVEHQVDHPVTESYVGATPLAKAISSTSSPPFPFPRRGSPLDPSASDGHVSGGS